MMRIRTRPASLKKDSTTGAAIDPGSPSVADGHTYCTSNWQVENSLFSAPLSRRRRRLQSGSDYTAPVIPEVIPSDVEEVQYTSQVSCGVFIGVVIDRLQVHGRVCGSSCRNDLL